MHSPVEHDEALGAALAALGGGVRHIVSPNFEHLKYAEQWAEVYPEANLYGCLGLQQRMPQLRFAAELDGKPVAAWEASMEYVVMDCEANPFTGKPFFNEAVLFHSPSRSLICSDAWWNYPAGAAPNYDGEGGEAGGVATGGVHDCSKVPAAGLDAVRLAGGKLPPVDVPMGTRAWKFGMDRVYLPFYQRLMVGASGPRRERYERRVAAIRAWQPETLVPCHGDVVRGRDLCRKVLETF